MEGSQLGPMGAADFQKKGVTDFQNLIRCERQKGKERFKTPPTTHQTLGIRRTALTEPEPDAAHSNY
jgi:hypothetical protein